MSQSALEISHDRGNERHRSEHCSLYIRENKSDFKISKIICPNALNRKDLRLTVDNPEDLVVCRILFKTFQEEAPRFSIQKMIDYLDSRKDLRDLIAPFTEIGYSTMSR